MLKVCENLFRLWNKDVRYCHWKSNEHLEEGLDGITDLDVFVLPADKGGAEKHLHACRYIKFQPQEGCRYPNVDEWIGFDEDTGKLVHVHLHYQIITGTKFCKEYVFPVDNLIIETRIQDASTGVFVTLPELEMVILYSRIALKAPNKKQIVVSEDMYREINYLAERVDYTRVLSLCNQIVGEQGENLYNLIKLHSLTKSQWYEVYLIVRKWLSPYRKETLFATYFRHKYHYVRLGVLTILNSKLKKAYITKKTMLGSGLSVCFIGQDGSGKSTVTSDLVKWLRWKVDAHRFYMGSGDGYKSLLNRLINVLRPSKNHEDDHLQRKVVKNRGLLKTCKYHLGMVLLSIEFVCIAKRALTQCKKAEKYKQKGAVAMMDRFPQIQFHGIYDGPKIASLAKDKNCSNALTRWMADYEEKALEKCQSYQPDIVIKLILPAEESMRRKPFENRRVVETKAQITPQIAFESSDMYSVDATQDYSKEVLEIKSLIWNKLQSIQSL